MIHAFVFLFFSALSLVFLQHLLPVWSSAIPGGLQDTRLFLWNAWWFRYAIDTLQQSPFSTTLLFHPFGTSLIAHDFPLWTNIVTFVGQACGLNFIAASNVWFILSWILAGFFTYLLVFEVVGVRAAAIVAGIYVMTHSYTLARAMQNWGQFNLWGIALFLWTLVRAKRKGGYENYALCGAALAWTAACHYYFLIYSGTIALLTALGTVWPYKVTPYRKGPFHKGFLIPAAIAAALAAYIVIINPGIVTLGSLTISMHTPTNVLLVMWLMLALYFLSGYRIRTEALLVDPLKRDRRLRYFGVLFGTAFVGLLPLIIGSIQLMAQGGYPKQTILWKTHLAGANLLALFSPNPIHAVWGPSVSRWFETHGMHPHEQAAGIGWVCLAIILMSQIWKRRTAMAEFLSPSAPDLGTRNWMFLAALSTVMAMGTYLHILWVNLWLPLPFYVWRLLPVFGNVRVPERWMAVGSIAWAVLLGLALVTLARKRNWPLTKLCVIAGALILLENWPGIPVAEAPRNRPIFQMLKAQPAGAVLHLPLYIGDSSIGAGHTPGQLLWDYLGYQPFHEKPVVGGYVGRIQRKIITAYKQDPFMAKLIDLEEEKPISSPIPDDAGCAAMKRFDIQYVLLIPSALNAPTSQFIAATLPLKLLQQDADIQLHRINCPQ